MPSQILSQFNLHKNPINRLEDQQRKRKEMTCSTFTQQDRIGPYIPGSYMGSFTHLAGLKTFAKDLNVPEDTVA